MNQITVIIAEDHTVVRQGLCSLLESEKDIKVLAQAQTGREAVELTDKFKPAVVVMDIEMPLLNGIEASRQILKNIPGIKILILSAHNNEEVVEQVLAFGASGYILKNSSVEDLSKAIREVYDGNTFFSPSITKRRSDKPLLNNKNNLTSREIEVIQLIAEGKANKQIADELSISIKTVEKHRQHVMEKLNIHDTAGITRYAISAGIIFLEKSTSIIK